MNFKKWKGLLRAMIGIFMLALFSSLFSVSLLYIKNGLLQGLGIFVFVFYHFFILWLSMQIREKKRKRLTSKISKFILGF